MKVCSVNLRTMHNRKAGSPPLKGVNSTLQKKSTELPKTARSQKSKPGGSQGTALRLAPYAVGIAIIVGVLSWYLTGGSGWKGSSQNSIRITKTTLATSFSQNITCHTSDYVEFDESCRPMQCARLIFDDFVTADELQVLNSIPKQLMKFSPGGTGGPTIFDINSGALSYDDHFVDAYKLVAQQPEGLPLQATDLDVVESVVNRIKGVIVKEFGLDENKIWLTSPSFFANITGGAKPKTMNDIYWKEHIDKIAYGSFVYTSLIYLSEYGVDFNGGTFNFVDEKGRKTTVEPRPARLSVFTSGTENIHYVERVTKGTRMAFTIAFTCDPTKQVTNFLARARKVIRRM